MRFRVGRFVLTVAVTCLFAGKLHAGDLQVVLVETSYAKPARFNVGGSLFFTNGYDWSEASNEGIGGFIVGGRVGRDAKEVWAGFSGLAVPGADLRAIVTRTGDQPRGASPNATYLGGELGLGTLGVRFTVGYSNRVSGPSINRDHIFTWGVGGQIPVWWGKPKDPKTLDPAEETRRLAKRK
jgi:hypothetical protein